MFEHAGIINQRAQIVVGQQLDLAHFVRRAEAVEEMEERHARFERGGLCDQRQSCASCTELEQSMAHPVERAAMTSPWSPKIDSACVARDRAAM